MPPRWRATASRFFGWALFAYVLGACVVLGARHLLLPQVDAYRPQIERLIGESLQREVRIDGLSADWSGLHPKLALRGVTLLDESGKPALRLEQVDAALGFSSLVRGHLHLHRLDINDPALQVRRDAAGTLHVAGLALRDDGKQGGFTRWLLSQGQINIRNARLDWRDETRPGAPPLQLSQVNMRLDNSGQHHRFGLLARPPEALAKTLELRGDILLPDESDWATASGELFASLEGADMAVWQTWIDYPLELPEGRGAARAWANFDGAELTAVTGELALANLKLRLAPELPLLDLVSLSGRISAEHLSLARVTASARQLQLVTQDGVRVRPTSIDLKWQSAVQGRGSFGEVSASAIDLQALTRLAAYLPLSQAMRDALEQHRPQGRLDEFDAGWTGDLSAPASFRVKARLDHVGMTAHGDLPGISGLSGSIEGTDSRGSVNIDAPGLTLDLPAVFAEPLIPFDRFRLKAGWSRSDGETAVVLESVSLGNADTEGDFRGRYRTAGSSAGEIDLEGRLTRGDARAIWRYLPLSIGADTRDWLRDSLVAGGATGATLKLRGKLDDYPFDKGRPGIFQVKVKAEDVTVSFGDTWPPITGLDADVLFEGPRMLITSRDGRILNTRLGTTTAEIPDLDVAGGTAAGARLDQRRHVGIPPLHRRQPGRRTHRSLHHRHARRRQWQADDLARHSAAPFAGREDQGRLHVCRQSPGHRSGPAAADRRGRPHRFHRQSAAGAQCAGFRPRFSDGARSRIRRRRCGQCAGSRAGFDGGAAQSLPAAMDERAVGHCRLAGTHGRAQERHRHDARCRSRPGRIVAAGAAEQAAGRSAGAEGRAHRYARRARIGPARICRRSGRNANCCASPPGTG
jgi:uncharacterized protein YhdP